MLKHFISSQGYVGDVMPYWLDGLLHLFYLRAPWEPRRSGTQRLEIGHAVSSDLAVWRELDDVMRGDRPYDLHGTHTGSVIRSPAGHYLFFYTGLPDLGQMGLSEGTAFVCRARSDDLIHWRKDDRNPISRPDASRFAPGHWRDPVVTYWAQRKLYLMTVSTAIAGGHGARAGAVAMLASEDLEHWSDPRVIWQPGDVQVPECCQLLQIGQAWYMLYNLWDKWADFMPGRVGYLLGESPFGPWRQVGNGRLDGGTLIAGKAVVVGDRIIYLSNTPTRENGSDAGNWQWGGRLNWPRRLTPRDDGSLSVSLADEVAAHLKPRPEGVSLEAIHGRWSELSSGNWQATGEHYALASIVPAPANDMCFALSIAPDGADQAGVILRMPADSMCRELNSSDAYPWPGYEISLDFRTMRLRVRAAHTDCGAMAELPLPHRPIHRLLVTLEGDLLEVFLNDDSSLTTMLYRGREHTGVGLFVQRGKASFGQVAILD